MTRSRRIGVMALLLAGLVGCVPVPRDGLRVTRIDTDRLGLTDTPVADVPERWWTAFGDPQLDRLVDRVLASNPDLAMALARVDDAQAQRLAATAATGVGINLDAQATRERLSANYIIPPPFGGGVYWDAQSAISLSWTADFWGRQRALIAAASDAVRARRLDHRAAWLALAGAVAQAYVDLDRAQAFEDLAARAEALRVQTVEITRARVRAGIDSELDLKRVEASVPQARTVRLQTQAAVALARHRLAALSGQGAEAYADIARPQLKLDAALPLPATLPMDLLRRRPDIQAALQWVNAAMSRRQAAAAAFYPDVNLRAFAGLAAIGLDRFVEHDAQTYGGTALFHLPLFDSRRLRAEYGASTAAVDMAVARYNVIVLHAVQQVADQLSLVDSYGAQAQQAADALAVARTAYRIANAQYHAGLITQLTVLDAEGRVLAAQRDAVDSQTRSAVARVSLLLALGGHYEPESQDDAPGVGSGAHS